MKWLADFSEALRKDPSDKVIRSTSGLNLLILQPAKPFINVVREVSSFGLKFMYDSTSIIFKLSRGKAENNLFGWNHRDLDLQWLWDTI